ncbi:MAG: hypothetical protein IPG44_14025 [Anaerolineales bacterium]|nr:hypothetical protein [Anaerolineales bacterium]
MIDLMRDSIWQFIGAVLGLIALIATIIIFFIQRTKKSLAYEIVTSTPLLAVSDEVKGKVQILFEGVQVQNVHLVIFNIINDGNIGITSSDFERPITINLSENAKILSLEVIKTSPGNLDPRLITSETAITISPLLLNAGDVISIRLLVAQYNNVINIDARILGITKIKIISDKVDRIINYVGITSLILLFAGFFTNGYTLLPGIVLLLLANISISYRDKQKKKRQIFSHNTESK